MWFMIKILGTIAITTSIAAWFILSIERNPHQFAPLDRQSTVEAECRKTLTKSGYWKNEDIEWLTRTCMAFHNQNNR